MLSENEGDELSKDLQAVRFEMIAADDDTTG